MVQHQKLVAANSAELADKLLASYLQFDEFMKWSKNNPTFSRFYEAPIKFQPTYKYSTLTNFYDTDKQRVPSW